MFGQGLGNVDVLVFLIRTMLAHSIVSSVNLKPPRKSYDEGRVSNRFAVAKALK